MTIRRRTVVAGAALGAALPRLPLAAPTPEVRTPAGARVLRYAFEVAETSLDPVKINDLYSRTLTPHIFEALYMYDHLARPVKIKPLTAEGMAEHSADYRVWTVKVRPGTFFADDPAFKGKPRELVAQDYVYSFKRFADPANKSPIWTEMEGEGYVGLSELNKRALKDKKPFDYDQEIEGIRALDRYTLRFQLKEPRPRFLETLATGDLYGAVARDVIEFYGDQAEAHPVGTGPFRLAQWRRSSLLVFERNPQFREVYYDAEPTADDVEGRRSSAKSRAGAADGSTASRSRSSRRSSRAGWRSSTARPTSRSVSATSSRRRRCPTARSRPTSPSAASAAIRSSRRRASSTCFNMDDPVVGGYTPAQVALRRAIGLGVDTRRSSPTRTTASAPSRKGRRCRTRARTTRR
jgi:hypothetical protein